MGIWHQNLLTLSTEFSEKTDVDVFIVQCTNFRRSLLCVYLHEYDFTDDTTTAQTSILHW